MIASECCCEESGDCGVMRVRATHRWGGFGQIPDWALGSHSLSSGDSDVAFVAFMAILESVFGPTLGSQYIKRFSLWGDSYKLCNFRHHGKRCGWSALHEFDPGEGPVAFSQEWEMEVDPGSGELSYGVGTNTGSTAFWTDLGVTGPENIGEFWSYNRNLSSGAVVELGSAFGGYAAADQPKAIMYLGALAYLAGSSSTTWPTGCSITIQVNDSDATLSATAPAGAYTTGAISTDAYVEMLGGTDITEAMEAAEDRLDLLQLLEGFGPFTAYTGNTPSTETMQWLTTEPNGTMQCFRQYSIEQVFWPEQIRIKKLFGNCSFEASAERGLFQGALDTLGVALDLIILQKGRVRPAGLRCLRDVGTSSYTAVNDPPYSVGSRYTCTFGALTTVCESPTDLTEVSPDTMLFYWGGSTLNQDCQNQNFFLTNGCPDCSTQYIPPAP